MTLDEWIDSARYIRFEKRRAAYWTAGSGRPLLMLHGYPTSSWDWHRVWKSLAQNRRVIACDMLGFGLSDKPSSGYSIHRQTDLQETLLAALEISDYDVLAHDYGVSVGQELLARHNEASSTARIGRIAFLNGGLFPEQHRLLPIQRLGVSPFGFLLGLFMNRQRFGKAFSQVFGPDTKPTNTELDEFWRLIEHDNGPRISHTMLHYIGDRKANRERWVGALQAATFPLKLINGGADPVSGRHLYTYFREMVPNADATCLESIGHYPQTEAPDAVLRELSDFGLR